MQHHRGLDSQQGQNFGVEEKEIKLKIRFLCFFYSQNDFFFTFCFYIFICVVSGIFHFDSIDTHLYPKRSVISLSLNLFRSDFPFCTFVDLWMCRSSRIIVLSGSRCCLWRPGIIILREREISEDLVFLVY